MHITGFRRAGSTVNLGKLCAMVHAVQVCSLARAVLLTRVKHNPSRQFVVYSHVSSFHHMLHCQLRNDGSGLTQWCAAALQSKQYPRDGLLDPTWSLFLSGGYSMKLTFTTT